MRIEIGSTSEVSAFVSANPSLTLLILFGGARLGCCSEAVMAKGELNQLLGFATIAPEGEEGSGKPTIVGLYVIPEARKGRKGAHVGTSVMEAAIAHCTALGFDSIHVDVLSTGAQRLIEKLPAELRAKLELNLDGVGSLDRYE